MAGRVEAVNGGSIRRAVLLETACVEVALKGHVFHRAEHDTLSAALADVRLHAKLAARACARGH